MDSLKESLLSARKVPKTTESQAIKAMVSSDKTWLLLVFIPLGFAASAFGGSSGLVFTLNFLAMIPLARILGDATEEVAAGLKSDTLGGLLNATFGNAVEMILTVQTIRSGLLTVAKGALLGSILSNLLLVLGMSFFFGGIGKKGKEQEFKESGPLVSMTMLLLAVVAFSVPTVIASTHHEHSLPNVALSVSRIGSVLILISYVAYLVFQLYTHRENFEDAGDDDGAAGATMSVKSSCAVLCLTTILVAASSECLVSRIEQVANDWHISQAFIGVILLPIIGNACEHVSAIRMSIHDRPILSIGIAVGSSCQIAMFVIPMSVLLGWWMGVDMDLNFETVNVVILALSVVIVTVILVDGKSTWIEGFMLQITYLVIATAYWYNLEEL